METDNDYILRGAAKVKIWKCPETVIPTQEGEEYLIAKIDSIPAADVRPVQKGEWEWSNVDGRCVLACSKCGSIMPTDHALDYIDAEDNRFCYWCGARMGGTP